MPLRQHKAKAHVFMDVAMEEVVKPTLDEEVRAGAGCKVVITVGPSCQDVPTLVRLLESGVTCARVNLSWGTKDYHARSLANLNEAMRQTKRLCSVFVDIMGREILVRRPVEYDETGWPIQKGDKTLEVEQGTTVVLTTDPTAEASPTLLPVNYPGFPEIVEPGHQLQIGRFLATGSEGASLYLNVLEKSDTTVTCAAVNSATLDGLLTVQLCHTQSDDFRADFALPLMSEHDADCIKYLGNQFEVDYVSLSYCNREEDLYAARAFLDSLGMAHTKIVAKVERKSAVHNFEGIAEAADGIIVSRGNLGLDFEPEAMALLQKRIIARCNQLGKPVLITRLVDTMVSTPRPTRAEATDVANAVLDGADGLVLGAETLRGLHPVLTVETVLRLCHAAERHFDYRSHHESLVGEAYEEEVSLSLAHPSISDFGAPGTSPDHSVHVMPPGGRLRPVGSSPALAARAREAPGTPSSAASGQTANGMNGTNDSAAKAAANGGLALEMTVGSPAAPYVSDFGSLRRPRGGSGQFLNQAPRYAKLESLASTATRTAEKINAGLIIVLVQSGRTVSLVAKYRPPMPVMAVVVPKLKSTRLGWQLEGKYLARQTCLLRGVVPMLAAPMSEGSEDLIAEAIVAAHQQRLVKANDYVVILKSVKSSSVVQVVQVNSNGSGMRVMGGPNSGGEGPGEEADVIGDASPFGGWALPVSPRVGALLPTMSAFGSGLLPSPRMAAAVANGATAVAGGPQASPRGAAAGSVLRPPERGLFQTLSEVHKR